MSDDPSHGEIQELLGAYALDAVSPEETAIIEAHLEACESCRVELQDHRRLAETLRRHASRVSPLASVESNGSGGTGEEAARARLVRRWGASMAILLVIIGGLLAQDQVRSSDLKARMARIELLERAQLAAADPTAVRTSLRTPTNAPALTVVSRAAGGDSYAMLSALPPLADGQTYQLWRLDSGGVTAAVAMGPRPDVVVFALPAGVTGFLITIEKGPGRNQPTLPAVASGRVLA